MLSLHFVAAKTCPDRPLQTARLRTGGPPERHSSSVASHPDRPDKGLKAPQVCLESPVPPGEKVLWLHKVSFELGMTLVSTCLNLFGDGGELHNMEGVVVSGRTLVDVDDHRGSTFAAEESLEELGEFAFSERNAGNFRS